jgi:hypothetical protein
MQRCIPTKTGIDAAEGAGAQAVVHAPTNIINLWSSITQHWGAWMMLGLVLYLLVQKLVERGVV